MKKSLHYISAISLLILSLIGAHSFISPFEDYYYAFEKRVYLEKLENKFVVRYTNGAVASTFDSLIKTISINIEYQWQDDRTIVITTKNNLELLKMTEEIKQQNGVILAKPIYCLSDTKLEMIITDEILVKFKSEISQKEIDSLTRINGLKLLKENINYKLYRVPRDKEALQLANIYQESGLVTYAQPNFISKIEFSQFTPNDTYFVNQWNLNNTGQLFNGHSGTVNADINAPEAWTISQGCNSITVAVLDEGLTSNHVDLPNTRQIRLPGSNFGDGNTDDPSPTGNNNHGNSCAGVIAATQNNNIGISGIAPNVKIMPIRIFNSNGGGIAAQSIADAITFAKNNGADILSNSWGYNSDNPNLQPVIVTAIQDAVNNGRNGKGCIVLFAAGNTASHKSGNNGFVTFPSNVNIAGVLTVGATDRYDKQANYSPTNQLIDICAPSHRAYPNQIAGETFEIWSMDIPGNMGYNPWNNAGFSLPLPGEILPNNGINNLDFTGRFGGTSAACPQVAAVVALMLSLNPNLTQQQLFSYITSNGTDKVGGYGYINGKCNELGYGRINALKCLQAVSPIITGPDNFCTDASYQVNGLPAGSIVTWTTSGAIQISGSNTANPVSVSKAFNGSGTLSANITSNCSNKTVSKSIVVGLQKPTNIVGLIPGLPVSPGELLELEAPDAGLICYNWTVQGGSIIGSSHLQSVLLKTNKCSGSLSNGWLNVQLSYQNSCGTGEGYGEYTTIDCKSGGAFLISPNPSKDFITISQQLIEGTREESGKLTNKLGYSAKIYDEKGLILQETQSRAGEDTTLDVSKIASGTYYLHIQQGEKIIKKQVIIKHE